MENIKKIIESLKHGNYEIKHREFCDCTFNWRFGFNEKNESFELLCDIKGQDCWTDNALIVDDQIVATYHDSYGINVSVPDPDKVIERTITDSDVIKRLWHNHDAENSLHDQRKVESLANWIKERKFKTYIQFHKKSSAYICQLVPLPDVFDVTRDELHVPRSFQKTPAEEWARMYLCRNLMVDKFHYRDLMFQVKYYRYDRDISKIEPQKAGSLYYLNRKDARRALKRRKHDEYGTYILVDLWFDDNGKIEDEDIRDIK